MNFKRTNGHFLVFCQRAMIEPNFCSDKPLAPLSSPFRRAPNTRRLRVGLMTQHKNKHPVLAHHIENSEKYKNNN